jgi:hypothetical protein
MRATWRHCRRLLVPEFLTSPFSAASVISPLEVLVRLVIAVGMGGVVAWIYRRTRTDHISTFPGTLVLLAVLIAMVTQVIGDSVARAFSLVGALSIVRFRTVVRDTQDTAFVIFSVVVGMACGASDPRVAVIGIAVVGAAAFVMRPKRPGADSSETFVLEIRVASGLDVSAAIISMIDSFASERRMTAVGTAKQGIAIETAYLVRLHAGQKPDELVKALNRIEGVQNVSLVIRPTEEPQV